MKQERSKDKNKTHLHESKRISKQAIKLPYLRQSKPMRPYYQHQPLTQHQLQYPQFDLHTNHVVMPRYQASKDYNLVYFFSKPSNQKIIDDLKQQQVAIKQKAARTSRLQQSLSLQNTKQVRVVSKLDFQKYLTKMKERVLSESKK